MKCLTLNLPQEPIHASVHIPGSKSYTNRALIIAALASGRSELHHASLSADSHALIAALKLLGSSIAATPISIEVTGRGGFRNSIKQEIDVGPAGTTMRFLTAFCAATQPKSGRDTVILRGSERMHARPIEPLTTALTTMGASISFLGNAGCPPLSLTSGRKLLGGSLTIDGSVSSQFISALLMVAPLYEQPLQLRVTGAHLSQSYIEMTIQSMSAFGVKVVSESSGKEDERVFTIPSGQRYTPQVYRVEGDASGASYFWGLAAVSGGCVCTMNVNPSSAQGDMRLPDLLKEMGCTVSVTQDSITVIGPERLTAIEADMSNMPDTAQTLAVVAACAEGRTVLRGLSTLRVKETDRITALHTELGKMGISSEQGPDYLVVHGGRPHAAQIATYEDHRMAMAFAFLAGVVDGIRIEEPEVVNKSFPTFWDTLAHCGIQLTQE
jgi:3-phosphoshikimate 1-carboxyvinyltransferase